MSCVFCAVIAGTCPSQTLYRDERVIAFLSLEGHPLVAPLGHLPSLEDLNDETAAAIFQCAKKIASAVRSTTGCGGVNLVLSDGQVAGQDVFHLHLHVKPRWKGDDVRLTWNTAKVPDADRATLADAIRTCLPLLSSV